MLQPRQPTTNPLHIDAMSAHDPWFLTLAGYVPRGLAPWLGIGWGLSISISSWADWIWIENWAWVLRSPLPPHLPEVLIGWALMLRYLDSRWLLHLYIRLMQPSWSPVVVCGLQRAGMRGRSDADGSLARTSWGRSELDVMSLWHNRACFFSFLLFSILSGSFLLWCCIDWLVV